MSLLVFLIIGSWNSDMDESDLRDLNSMLVCRDYLLNGNVSDLWKFDWFFMGLYMLLNSNKPDLRNVQRHFIGLWVV